MPRTMAWQVQVLLLTACLAGGTLAAAPPNVASAMLAPIETGPAVLSPSATVPSVLAATAYGDLRRRQSDENEDEDEQTSRSRSSESTSTPSSTRESIVSAPSSSTTTAAQSALPSPFDISLGSYFTTNDGTNCPAFLHSMLSHDDYKRCYPISMLIDTSQSWFEATRQLVSAVRVLDTACDADVDFCTDYFNGVAEDLLLDENCGSQYRNRLNIVKQAYDGLVSYELIYKATCLQDAEESQYCYANAVTSSNNASNVYPFYLPLNFTFPASATPTCNWCLEEMMGIFHAASADRDQYISLTYENAAKQINTVCGPEFANTTLPEARDSSSASFTTPSWLATFALLATGVVLHFA